MHEKQTHQQRLDRGNDLRIAGFRQMQKLQSGDEFTVQVMRDRKSLTLKGKVEAPAARRSRTIL